VPLYDHVCFHSHECTEKYLKGRLIEANIDFPKTHNLPHLLTLLLPIEPEWGVLEPSLLGLKAFGVSIVYPGKKADKADAQTALLFCREVREVARRSLGLPV
jgi:HEPN domain-containing protein